VLEVGCGGSRWLPYFDCFLNCEVWGIDYSLKGLHLAKRNLLATSACRLVLGDFFDERLLPKNYFDLIYSLGFIEHFDTPDSVTERFLDLLKPGGIVVTVIPNFVGPYGTLQKLVDDRVYRKHIVMNRYELDRTHYTQGLFEHTSACFFGCFGPGVVNFGRLNSPFWKIGRFIYPAISFCQQSVCWTLHSLHCDFESQFASPYILGIYRKK
jgi:SAM-dependent methyltransferase